MGDGVQPQWDIDYCLTLYGIIPIDITTILESAIFFPIYAVLDHD